MVEFFLVLLLNNKPTYWMCFQDDRIMTEPVVQLDTNTRCQSLTYTAYTQLVDAIEAEANGTLD